MKSIPDYTKFLTSSNNKPPKPSQSKPITLPLSSISTPSSNFNPKVVNRYNSAKRIQSSSAAVNDNFPSSSISIVTDHDNSYNIKAKPSHSNTNNNLSIPSGVGSYLNRRHVQELERLKRYKDERERKEREEFSFKPKISNKSRAIVKNLSSGEQVGLGVNSKRNQSNSFVGKRSVCSGGERNERYKNYMENIGGDNRSHIEMNMNMNDYVNRINASTCYDKENVVKYKLDVEAKEYVLERMKVLRNQYYHNK